MDHRNMIPDVPCHVLNIAISLADTSSSTSKDTGSDNTKHAFQQQRQARISHARRQSLVLMKGMPPLVATTAHDGTVSMCLPARTAPPQPTQVRYIGSAGAPHARDHTPGHAPLTTPSKPCHLDNVPKTWKHSQLL